MLEEICIIFITILTCSLAFNLSCPGSGQWNYRAVFYCSDLNKYTCLLDTSKTRYTETCDGPRDELEGHKSTINRNNFDTAKCRPDRFQPKDFITVENSDCVFQKSKCAQEGQIAAHENKEKTSLLDTKCLCDYTKGYSFINLPKDNCYCSPLVDDCSCFRDVCPSGKILSPDYQCTSQIDMKNRKWNCSKIATADDSQNGDQVQQSIKDIDPKNERRSKIAVQVIVPILVFIMAGLLIWCWKTSKIDKIEKRIMRLDPSCQRLSCFTVHEKHDNNKSEAFTQPTGRPFSSGKNYEIQHESLLFRSRSNSINSIHDKCSSTEVLKFQETDDHSMDQCSQTNRSTDQRSQTDQSDLSVREDDDEVSFKSAKTSLHGLNETEDNQCSSNNSTGTTLKSDMTKVVSKNGENKSGMNSELTESKTEDPDISGNTVKPGITENLADKPDISGNTNKPGVTENLADDPDISGNTVKPGITENLANEPDISGNTNKPGVTENLADDPDISGNTVKPGITENLADETDISGNTNKQGVTEYLADNPDISGNTNKPGVTKNLAYDPDISGNTDKQVVTKNVADEPDISGNTDKQGVTKNIEYDPDISGNTNKPGVTENLAYDPDISGITNKPGVTENLADDPDISGNTVKAVITENLADDPDISGNTNKPGETENLADDPDISGNTDKQGVTENLADDPDISGNTNEPGVTENLADDLDISGNTVKQVVTKNLADEPDISGNSDEPGVTENLADDLDISGNMDKPGVTENLMNDPDNSGNMDKPGETENLMNDPDNSGNMEKPGIKENLTKESFDSLLNFED